MATTTNPAHAVDADEPTIDDLPPIIQRAPVTREHKGSDAHNVEAADMARLHGEGHPIPYLLEPRK